MTGGIFVELSLNRIRVFVPLWLGQFWFPQSLRFLHSLYDEWYFDFLHEEQPVGTGIANVWVMWRVNER